MRNAASKPKRGMGHRFQVVVPLRTPGKHDAWPGIFVFVSNRVPIASMKLEYLHTFTLKINHSCRWIYHRWIVWGWFQFVPFFVFEDEIWLEWEWIVNPVRFGGGSWDHCPDDKCMLWTCQNRDASRRVMYCNLFFCQNCLSIIYTYLFHFVCLVYLFVFFCVWLVSLLFGPSKNHTAKPGWSSYWFPWRFLTRFNLDLYDVGCFLTHRY